MHKLLDEFSSLHYVQSYTTRAVRSWETNGEKYWHISKDVFEQGIAADAFLEYALVHNQDLYGTKLSAIMDVLERWKTPIKEIEIAGYKQVHAHETMNTLAKSIFLTISDDIVRQRILNRDPNTPAYDIEQRIASAEKERQYAQDNCDIVIDAGRPLEEVEHDVIQALYSLGLWDEQ